MPPPLPGIHHVTAICGDPQRNIDFYTGALGLRLVKQTVNFDDPERYHLYYGDARGTPGSLITFFAWPGARGGQRGLGQFTVASFAVPTRSLGYWVERLVARGIPYEHPRKRFGEQVLAFRDPDGLPLEIVASSRPLPDGLRWGDVPAEHAIRRLHAVELWEHEGAGTTRFLADRLGFRRVEASGNRRRYAVGDARPGTYIDVVDATGLWSGTVAVGTIHHVAWRTADDGQQAEWREHLVSHEVQVSPVRDRQYFRSIYFEEPGGALFEIATDIPGFAVDEPIATLGTRLCLPPQYESRRAHLEATLPTLRLPALHLPQDSRG